MHENTQIANQPQISPAALANEAMQLPNGQSDLETELNERLPIQLKLSVGAANDPLEYEADAMADKVMRMPETSFIQRKAGCSCSDYDDEHVRLKPLASQITPFIQAKENSTSAVSDAVSGKIKSSMGGGNPMQSSTKSFMESRFGTDFSDVKIHNGEESAELNRSLNAKAFTVSNNIYFNNGQYQPETDAGKHLLAHELTHVVQQNGSPVAAQREPIIQRQVDGRIEDPNFLMCLAFCELGMPPGMWREVVDEVMQAVSVEYGGSLQTRWFQQRSPAFRQWSVGFSSWSNYNKLKFVLVFIAEGKIGFVPIRLAATNAIRLQLLTRLAAFGIRESAVVAASQVIRKVALFLELAYAAGCAAYCGSMQMANALIGFTEQVAQTLSSLQTVIQGIGNSITQGISQIFLTVQATMEPSNWHYNNLPARSQRHLNVIGVLSGLNMNPDDFSRFITRPINSFNIDVSILTELSTDINSVLQSRGGVFQGIQFTPDFIGRMGALSLIQILNGYGIITYVRNPEEIANERLQQSNQPQTN
jgi:hypothetical protein